MKTITICLPHWAIDEGWRGFDWLSAMLDRHGLRVEQLRWRYQAGPIRGAVAASFEVQP